MAKQKKYATSPLLYIHQPEISSPKAPMQSNYATPKKEKQVEPESTVPKIEKWNTRPPMKKSSKAKSKTPPKEKTADREEKPREPKATAETEDRTSKAESNKKFNDMTVSEKIDYFISKPEHIPRMKCEVKTEERSYRGTITNVEEDQVLMRVGKRSSITKISIESITEIRLIGF